MQRIFNVDHWVVIEPGQVLEFPSTRPRQVRLEVNSAEPSQLYLLDAENTPYFLARVVGRDTVEFISPGKFSITAFGSACSVYTVDGSNVAHTVEAPVSFTRIVERRHRSPEIEYIAAMMSRNMENRLAQQAGELQAQFERREREREARAAATKAASVRSDDAGKPEQAGNASSDGDAVPSGKRGQGSGSG